MAQNGDNIMRFHVLPNPGIVSNKDFLSCAFTQKAIRFCEMMKARGHEVIHYGHEESDLDCTEHVTVLTSEQWKECYGDYDWRNGWFKYSVDDLAHTVSARNAIEEIAKRKQRNDFILPFWGFGNKPVCDAFPDLIVVEPGIGYPGGHFAPYKVFESYAMHSAYYGLHSVGTCNEKWYDVVIPSYFNLDKFEFTPDKKEDYFLYLGRVYDGKGVNIAIQVTEAIGAKLIIAGQNTLKNMGYDKVPDHVTEYGYADEDTRKYLMSRAKGAFVASLYNEPFGSVHVECMISGTPVITTDWGAFTEYNIHGVTGYRCRTFEQFVWAAKNIDKINPQDCRDWGAKNFSYDKVGSMYEEYFQSILNIYNGNGWYEPNDARTELDWLKKEYPNGINTI